MKQGERWAIFYTNGTVFTSKDAKTSTRPWQAPRTGVQCVASCKNKEEADYYLIQQVDRYYYEADKGGWNDCPNDTTFYLHLLRAKFPCVVYGEMMSDEDWRALFKRITKWCTENRDWLVGQSHERPPTTF